MFYLLLFTNFRRQRNLNVLHRRRITCILNRSLGRISTIRSLTRSVIRRRRRLTRLILRNRIRRLRMIITIRRIRIFCRLLMNSITLTRTNDLIRSKRNVSRASIYLLNSSNGHLLLMLSTFLLDRRLRINSNVKRNRPLRIMSLTSARSNERSLILLNNNRSRSRIQ